MRQNYPEIDFGDGFVARAYDYGWELFRIKKHPKKSGKTVRKKLGYWANLYLVCAKILDRTAAECSSAQEVKDSLDLCLQRIEVVLREQQLNEFNYKWRK